MGSDSASGDAGALTPSEQTAVFIAIVNERGAETFRDPELIELMHATLDPEIESVVHDNLALTGVYRGIDGYLRMQREWADAWESIHYDLEDFLDRGDVTLGIVRYRAKAKIGAEVETRVGWLSGYRDGRLRSWEVFGDLDRIRREASP